MPTMLDDCSDLAVCDDPGKAMRAVAGKLAARGFGVRSPGWERYWHVFAHPTPIPEERIVEGLALTQVWHTLSPHIREVFGALAVHGDCHQAAESVSKTPGQFYSQIAYARTKFLATWHDGQTPSRPWGHDRRRHATRVTGRSTAKIIRQRHAKTLR